MKVSSPPLVRGRIAARLIAWTIVVCMLAACTGREHQQEERAKRARQMRDVSRMLDSMEADTPAAAQAASLAAAPPRAPASASAAASAKAPAPAPVAESRSTWSLLAILAITISGGLAIPAAAAVMWRRRKRVVPPRAEAPSIAACFATSHTEDMPEPQEAQSRGPLTWVYRSSSFETPCIHMVTSPSICCRRPAR